MIVCLNGGLIPEGEAVLGATHPGLLLGAGVFETLRAVWGVGFLLERHYARLAAGAERIGTSVPFGLEELAEYVRQLGEVNRCEEGRVRITLVRGREGEGEARADFVIQVSPLGPQPAGWRATCAAAGRAAHSPLAGVKSTSYLDYLLLREGAVRQGFQEALLLDERGRLVEGAASNVFLVQHGRIATPEERTGLLPGITRGFLLENLAGWGWSVREATLSLADLEAADEVFCSNAVVGVMPVSHVEGKALGSLSAGSISRQVAAAYRQAREDYVEAARGGEGRPPCQAGESKIVWDG
ncbi:aminotransferase class IV [bacterium]|nr:aminotransferase class IV [bacterium]